MKKVLLVLFGIVLLVGCTKFDEFPTPPPTQTDIFSVKESTVTNGQEIKFNLKTEGIYTLTLFDSTTQQVVTRERINGKIGINNLKLYTKSLPIKYLYLTLEDQNSVEVGKTLLIIN